MADIIISDNVEGSSSKASDINDKIQNVSSETITYRSEADEVSSPSNNSKLKEAVVDEVAVNECEASTSKEEEEPEWLDILGSGHLKKKIIVKGTLDSRPHRGDTVVIDVLGKLEDGTEFENIEKLEITIGDAEVVQGIEYALPLMNTGETAEIIVGPRFGYGSLGDLPRIPHLATLNYTITLKEVLGIKDLPATPIEERLSLGLKKKDRGNWWYQRREHHLAIQCYKKALQCFEEDLPESNSQIEEAKLKTYNNLSVAHFNIEAYDAALTSVDNVLAKQPDNIKAVYRKVKILKAQGEIDQAISLAKKGIKAKPDSTALIDELNSLTDLKKKSTSAQKALYRKMFKNSDDKNKKDPKSKRTIYSITWKWLGILTVAVGILGAAAIKFKY